MRKKLGIGLVLSIAILISLFYMEKTKIKPVVEPEIEPETQVVSEMETESETQLPEVITVTITATGDCTLGKTQQQPYEGCFWQYYDLYGEGYFFENVKSVFEEDDFTLVNLECVLTNSEDRVDKEFNLKGKPEYAGIMSCSSVEACSFANNHIADYGEQSTLDTIAAVETVGVQYAQNEHTVLYTTDSGIKIGVVAASLLNESQERIDYILNGIASLKEQGADIVIAACHWGIEKQYYPTEFQQIHAHEFIDAGADLIIGNHPHVLQGVEYYNGKVICYSLGNFCFGGNRNPSDKDTAIFQQTFTFVDKELQADINAKIIPCSVSSVTDRNDFKPTIAEGTRKQTIINSMNDYSANYSSIYIDENGNLLLE